MKLSLIISIVFVLAAFYKFRHTAYYYEKYNDISFWWAKRKANKLHKKFRFRYYVLPKSRGYGYNVVSSRRVSNYNRKKGKNSKLNINELLRLAVWFTPDSCGNKAAATKIIVQNNTVLTGNEAMA